ncbi:MAG: hypothetical protein RR101_13830 [Burkholderiaceae bacterium]
MTPDPELVRAFDALGLPCVGAGSAFGAFLDAPANPFDAGGVTVHARTRELTYVSGAVTLPRGSTVFVAGVAYTTLEVPRALDDGALSVVLMDPA